MLLMLRSDACLCGAESGRETSIVQVSILPMEVLHSYLKECHILTPY